MPTGEIAHFSDQGKYGFIVTDDSDEEVFVHMADVGGPDLEEGQEVEFEIEQADKGPRAANLTRLGDAAGVESDDGGGRRTEDGVIVTITGVL